MANTVSLRKWHVTSILYTHQSNPKYFSRYFEIDRDGPIYTRKTGVQFANIRRWSCVKAFCIFDLGGSTHALQVMSKVSTQVYMLDRKIWNPFRLRRNGWKNTKCDQFFCPTSDFFDFLQSRFLLSYLYHWCIFYWQSFIMQKYVTTVCLHYSFAILKNYHLGVLGTNVASTSWLHCSPVSWCGYNQVSCRGQLDIPKGHNSKWVLFLKVLFRRVIIPKFFYLKRSLFRRFLSRRVIIPNFRVTILLNKNLIYFFPTTQLP